MLSKSNYYSEEYTVSVNGESNICKTEEIKAVQPGTVSLKSVVVSEDGKTAEISLYNASFIQKTNEIVGTDALGNEIISQSVTIPAESVSTFSLSGENLNTLTWNVQ